MRKRPTSPSAKMRRLSRDLEAANVQADLPSGTPPTAPRALVEATAFEEQNMGKLSISEPKTSGSDDTFSTFSWPGDFLPTESADIDLINVAGTDNDFVAIKRIAQVLAKRRNIDVDTIMPKLLKLFAAQSLQNTGLGIQLMEASPNDAPARKDTKVKTKASGFFHKLRSQALTIDTGLGRRFSFEAGDDEALSAPAAETISLANNGMLPNAVRERLLRKCVSTSVLADFSNQKVPTQDSEGPRLSPVQQSPTTLGSLSESRPPSKIPTPTYGSGMLARPRQEREDSASSLLTAIKLSEDASCRKSDMSELRKENDRPMELPRNVDGEEGDARL